MSEPQPRTIHTSKGVPERLVFARGRMSYAANATLKGDAAVFVNRSAAIEEQGDPLRASEPTRWLKCLHCNQNVTKTSDRINVDGKHEYSFINPVGVIFRIGCFGAAAGVVEVGEASGHFTWFAGHVWRIALCIGCEQHLGWAFHGRSSRFFGLVLAQLKEANLP